MTRARLAGLAGLIIAVVAAGAWLAAGGGAGKGVSGRPSLAHVVTGPMNYYKGGRRIGALNRGRIGFAITLRLHERRLNTYLSHAPGTGSRSRMTATEFGARFGESDGQIAQLRALLASRGITVTHLYPQRTAMLVTAAVARLQHVFGVRLGRYEAPDGRAFFAVDHPAQIPAALTRYVAGVADLSNAPMPADDIPAGGLTPKVTAAAYDIAPLWSRGDNGRGQTIAVASLEGAINPEDLHAFATQYGVPEPNVEVKKIDGGSAYNPQAGSDIEVDLDLQVVGGVAPGARILDYQGSAAGTIGRTLADIYNQIEQDGLAKIVTTSYGVCETQLASQDPGGQQLVDNSLKALEASGVTVFIATGDTGAYACLQQAQPEPLSNLPSALTGLSVQAPSSSPYAIAVGGTSVSLRADGGYLAESAWSNPLERSGDGGGISSNEPRPVWQQGPGVTTAAPNPGGHRQTPDVAGPADSYTGFGICVTPPNQSSPACQSGYGGTSAASPFWAASMLLVQQYAAQHGAGKLASCFAAPILYDLAASHQPVPPFHQIVLGNDGYYPAKPGWNYATGLGTPDVFNLAQDYASFLHKRSSRTCPF